MRGDANASAARRTRDRAIVRTRGRLVIAALASLAIGALSASPAFAGLYHPKPPVASFGPLGGACAEGDLATGTGDLTSGSTEITSAATTCGAFAVGQEITATGLSARIIAVGAGTLTVSSAASQSGSAVALAVNSTFEKSGEGASLVAYTQATKRLYLIDNPLEKAFGFDLSSSGSYVPLGAPFPLSLPELQASQREPQARIAVDNSGGATAGNIYVATEEGGETLIHGYDSSGAPRPGFPIASPPEPLKQSNTSWTALAVDPDGNIWGGNFRNNGAVAYEYSPAGTLLNTVALPGSEAESLAFAANGDLYVNSLASQSAVWKLSAPAYDNPRPFVEAVFGALTVDRATGDLYIASGDSGLPNRERVLRYRSDGTLLEEFAPILGQANRIGGVSLDETSGAAYVSTRSKVFVFEALVLPDLATAPIGAPTETTATLNGSVAPSGVALAGCKFEWVTEAAYQATGFASLSSGGEKACSPAFGSIPASGQTSVSAAITGLMAGEIYRYRLSASNVNGTNTTKGVPASFALAKPGAETVGSPVRSATTTRLDSRVDPHGIATEYHFQYIPDARYQANLAAAQPPFEGATETPARSAGSGALIEMVSQTIESLSPGATYQYRVVADNGAFGGPAFGEAMSLTTRASDAPLSHGRFAGPSGSDRAWEQVNLPDTGGNPVSAAAGISSDGESAIYQVSGGTPVSESGTLFDYLFARRPAGDHPETGWQTRPVFPSRAAATFNAWRPPAGDDALSALLALNINFEEGSGAAVWRIPTAGGAPAKLYEAAPGRYKSPYMFSDDGSRALLVLDGSVVDPEHHSPGGVAQLYDVSSGVPRMVSLLPGNTAPSCGTQSGQGGVSWLSRSTHWVSADGLHAFFSTAGNGTCGTAHLYVRDFAASETFRVDGPPLSGPDCGGWLIRSTPDAAFFWTQSRLAPEDTAIAGGCGSQGGGDVYRYDLASHALKCVTCVVPGGAPANVDASTDSHLPTLTPESVAVAPDGSRVYFTTKTRLLPGTAETGTPALYRVDVASGSLAYIAPLAPGETVGENPPGSDAQAGSAVSPNGGFLIFGSSSPGLDALTGSDNANTVQYYVYDDSQRTLSCASCRPDGSAPRAAASKGIITETEPGPNTTSLAENGDFAFTTPTALVAGDQNTAPAGRDPSAGADVYEWRDGRPLLVSDGLTDWPSSSAVPEVAAISPDGKNLFFTEAARLTPDAPDGYQRLYDARIGGGIDFPEAAKPCPLEVCQGTPKGAPEEAQAGSVFFSGPGNLAPPSVTAPAKPKAKVLTRAQLLAKALRACNRKPKKKRAACRAQARRRYGAKKARKAARRNRKGAR